MSMCCICKSHYGIRANLTFHSIPRLENLKAKWIAVIGREVTQTSKICSDHFSFRQFQFKLVNGKVRRFLKKGSIPRVEKFDNCLLDISYEESSESEDTTSIDESSSVSCTSDGDNDDDDNDEDDEVESKLLVANTSNLKRKRVNDVSYKSKVRAVRYIGDLRPEHFVSPEQYNIVQRYVKQSSARILSLRRKNSRLVEKVQYLGSLIKYLQSNQPKDIQEAD